MEHFFEGAPPSGPLYAPVVFAGAGPGDPDLITVKAAQALGKADVLLYDRLVNDEIIQRYVPHHCKRVHVGKQAGKAASTPQPQISRMLVRYARQGHRVVRLKGGDVSVFSNILDELSALTEAGIPFEIIPGITAASGAAAYAGIPLTARGYARSVRFITGHEGRLDEAAFFRADETLVIYMGVRQAAQLVAQWPHGADRPLAIVEQATTPGQQVHITSLHNLPHYISHRSFGSPALIIVGEVVRLHPQFQWFRAAAAGAWHFREITGRQIDYSPLKRLAC